MEVEASLFGAAQHRGGKDAAVGDDQGHVGLFFSDAFGEFGGAHFVGLEHGDGEFQRPRFDGRYF